MNPRSATRPLLAASPFSTTVTALPAITYAVNDRITHDRHGLGTVVSLYGANAMIVDFGSHRRQIALPNTKVTKL